MNTKRFIIPIEVYGRGFDAKLLVALKLLVNSKSPVEVIIGFDKNITTILQETSLSGVLLDKSCSDIMYAARIKPILKKGGRICIADEEGVNNLKDNFKTLETRFSPSAVAAVHRFLAWGKLDEKLAANVGFNSERINIVGNSRLDLLSDCGKTYFSGLSESIAKIFGPFLLFNDNFAVEHFDKNYRSPTRSFLSDKDKKELEISRKLIKECAKVDRQNVVEWILNASQANPHLNYIIRPHPVSDPDYWLSHLGRYRNIHVIYKHSVEPWLFGAQAVISCGCTTSIQAAIAGTPVYHFPSVRDNSSSSIASCLGQTIDKNDYNLPVSSPLIASRSLDYISSYIDISSNCSSRVADLLFQESNRMESMQSIPNESIIKIRTNLKNICPFEPKWRNVGLGIETIENKLFRLSKSFSIAFPPIQISKLLNSVFLLSNAN